VRKSPTYGSPCRSRSDGLVLEAYPLSQDPPHHSLAYDQIGGLFRACALASAKIHLDETCQLDGYALPLALVPSRQRTSAMTHPDPTAHDTFRATRLFGSLDGLRALSILAVLWHHSANLEGLGQFASRGFLGVDMFFVLSGFLITTLLLREREAHGNISLRAFYGRRFFRIFPLYYGVILFSLVVINTLMPRGQIAADLWPALPFLLTYTMNWVENRGFFDYTWSLAAEEQFYLLWPPIEKWFTSSVPVLMAFLGLSQAIAWGAFDPLFATLFGLGPESPAMLKQSTFTPILLGVLLAHLLHGRSSYERVASLLGHRWAAPTALVAAIGAIALMPDGLPKPSRFLIHLTMVTLLGTSVVQEKHLLARFLGFRALRRIGAISYGMYMLHMFVRAILLDRLHLDAQPDGIRFAAVLLGTIVVAELSFRFFETPFLRLKHRFAR
jgi:peptidoglycan/LPS O-acetylase OafA/YrhL